MQKYYTAVGRFERKGRMGDMTCPMVIINNREYALDIQEMILWAALNWQIMDAGSLEDAYSAKLKASGIRPQRSISDCMRRLMQRGLVVEGCGETDEDALYALLSGLYVVPISDSLLLRLISFIKLTVFGHVPFAVMIRTARRHERLTRGTVNRSRPIVVGTRCLPIHICRRKSPYLVSGSAHRTSTMQIFCVISSPRQ